MSSLAALTALPIALWESSLGVYLTVKGFNADELHRQTAPVKGFNGILL